MILAHDLEWGRRSVFVVCRRAPGHRKSITDADERGWYYCVRTHAAVQSFHLEDRAESEVALRDLFEHYLQDMAKWFKVDGRYDTSLVWEQGYQAYLAKVDDSMAGFAWWDRRRSGWATLAPTIFTSSSCCVDFGEAVLDRGWPRSFGMNSQANGWYEYSKPMRRLLVFGPAISRYSRGLYHEEGRVVKERSWRFFRFGSSGK